MKPSVSEDADDDARGRLYLLMVLKNGQVGERPDREHEAGSGACERPRGTRHALDDGRDAGREAD
jgi:hypothetical protein